MKLITAAVLALSVSSANAQVILVPGAGAGVGAGAGLGLGGLTLTAGGELGLVGATALLIGVTVQEGGSAASTN